MAYKYAVRYFDAQFDTNSQLVKNQPFTLWKNSGATQPATTYTDRTKSTVQSGALATDNKGMATFWVDPGTYWIKFGTNTPVELPELREDNDETVSIGSDDWLKANMNLDLLFTGTITRDSNGTPTSASVVWPDGTSGTYTATTVSSGFPGAVDAYRVTYVGATTKTVTQAAVTRNATGAVSAQPALVVS